MIHPLNLSLNGAEDSALFPACRQAGANSSVDVSPNRYQDVPRLYTKIDEDWKDRVGHWPRAADDGSNIVDVTAIAQRSVSEVGQQIADEMAPVSGHVDVHD